MPEARGFRRRGRAGGQRVLPWSGGGGGGGGSFCGVLRMPEARAFRRAGRGKSAPPVRRGESGPRDSRRPLSYSTGSDGAFSTALTDQLQNELLHDDPIVEPGVAEAFVGVLDQA